MTTERRLERDLPQILDELAMGPYPDYIDDVLATTAQRRQRPAWTFPERWLPVDIATKPVLASKVPWRSIGVLTIIALLVAATIAVYVGTQPRLPAPFGLARNGLVAYAADGDIYTVDPATSVATAVVTGPETDQAPVFSPDGTRLVFERKVDGSFGPGQLYVARANGTGLTLLTPEPPFVLDSYAFSPDGQEVMLSSLVDGVSTISFARVDGSGVRTLDVGIQPASEPEYRPPNGDEIVFVGNAGGPASGLYLVRPDGTGLRTLIEPSNFVMDDPRWAPDGSRIAYTSWAVDYSTGGRLARVNIVSADGRTDGILGPHPQADVEGYPAWSNDGTRLLITRCVSADADVTDGPCEPGYAVVPADGSGPGIDIEWNEPGATEDAVLHHWAPDDTTILTTMVDAQRRPLPGSQLWDPVTGRKVPAPWAVGAPSWQRLAP